MNVLAFQHICAHQDQVNLLSPRTDVCFFIFFLLDKGREKGEGEGEGEGEEEGEGEIFERTLYVFDWSRRTNSNEVTRLGLD